MSNYITDQDLAKLIQFAEDDRIDIEPALIERLNALHAAVIRNTVRHLTGTRKRNAMLQERLDRYKERENTRIQTEGFGETDMSSKEIAKGILYQLQQRKSYMVGKQKVNLILFEMYSSWLHTEKKRLCDEQPVAIESGPRFWGAFHDIDTDKKVPFEDWKALCEHSSAIAAVCKTVVEKYYNWSVPDLEQRFKKSIAYKNAHKDNNGGKWNKKISDQDIYAWRESIKP